MKNIKFPVLFTTFYLVVYTVLLQSGAGLAIMLPLFILSPFLVVWMVIRVLKDGTPSGKKFNDGCWYDDHPYRAIRNSR